MKKRFAYELSFELREMSKCKQKEDWDGYKWYLTRVTAQIDLAYHIGLINFDRWAYLNELSTKL